MKIRSCLPYIVWIYQTDFIFLSLTSNQTSESRVTLLCSCNFFCGDIKTVALKRFYYTGIKCCSFLFVSLWLRQEPFSLQIDSFRHGTQPDQPPPSDPFEGPRYCHLDKKIFTTWRIMVVLQLNKGGPSDFISPKPPESQDTAAGSYIRLCLLAETILFTLFWLILLMFVFTVAPTWWSSFQFISVVRSEFCKYLFHIIFAD